MICIYTRIYVRLHSFAVHSIAFYCIALYFIASHLHYIASHYFTLHYITVYSNWIKYIGQVFSLTHMHIYIYIYYVCVCVSWWFYFRSNPFPYISIGSKISMSLLVAAQVRVASPVCSASCHLHQGPSGDSLVKWWKITQGWPLKMIKAVF